ncbi:kinase-like protein [Mycena polygramma]|nr:kinase-like protein [Mycena polygramma]
MQRRIQIITTALDTSRLSPTRSPLSPIPPPNKVKPHKKSIRQVAWEHMQKPASQGALDAATRPSRPRRTVKLWGERKSGERQDTTEIDRRAPHHTLADNVNACSTDRSPGSPSFRWVLGHPIGRGAHGRVHLALNATTGEMLAAKQFTFPSGANESLGRPSHRTLKREIANMENLDHPNLVQYLGFVQSGDLLSLFTEYVSGGSIHENLRKHGVFDPNVVKSFASQILDGLIYLHARGLVHGDLKSTNILVEPTGICKIEGLSCSVTEVRDNSRAVPRAIFWTAPEIIRTQYKAYNAMADIWSLGCVVLEMLTGHRPWFNTEAVAVMYKLYHQTHRPLPPADSGPLDPVAVDFTEKCLALEPENRLSAVELKQHPFLLPSPEWSFNGFRPGV